MHSSEVRLTSATLASEHRLLTCRTPHCEQSTQARGPNPKPPTMSTQFPLLRTRIPVLQRQCLFLRYQSQTRPHNLSLGQTTISTARAFSSTPSRPVKRRQLGTDRAQTRAAAAASIGPAPSVGFEQAQSNVEAMQEDIGLLQNTMIRAPFRELSQQSLWLIPTYFWKLIKSKGTALYS